MYLTINLSCLCLCRLWVGGCALATNRRALQRHREIAHAKLRVQHRWQLVSRRERRGQTNRIQALHASPDSVRAETKRLADFVKAISVTDYLANVKRPLAPNLQLKIWGAYTLAPQAKPRLT